MIAAIYIVLWCLGLFCALCLLVFIVMKCWSGRINDYTPNDMIDINLETTNVYQGPSSFCNAPNKAVIATLAGESAAEI